jgi:hypothetical protein
LEVELLEVRRKWISLTAAFGTESTARLEQLDRLREVREAFPP